MGAASGGRAVVRKLTVFLTDMRDSIGLLFGPSRADVQEELSAYWAALNILVMRGDLDGSTPIPVGDHRSDGFSGFMSLRAVLRTVQSGWGRWDRKTEARWCQILEEATRNLLHEDAGLGCEL
jgi:hypothetical protein